MTAKERLRLINQPFITSKEIMQLNDCAESKSYEIIRIVRDRHPNSIAPMRKQIRTDDYMETFGLTLEEFIRAAKLERLSTDEA